MAPRFVGPTIIFFCGTIWSQTDPSWFCSLHEVVQTSLGGNYWAFLIYAWTFGWIIYSLGVSWLAAWEDPGDNRCLLPSIRLLTCELLQSGWYFWDQWQCVILTSQIIHLAKQALLSMLSVCFQRTWIVVATAIKVHSVLQNKEQWRYSDLAGRFQFWDIVLTC